MAEGRLRYDSTKYTHHFKPRLLAYLGRKPETIDAHSEFFLHNARMYSEATLIMLEVAEELDRQLPGYGFAERTRARDHHHLLRLLRYVCDGPTPDIAIAHRDKNFMSVHIRSDRGGLWLADSKNHVIRDAEETRSNSVLLFFGRDAWRITRGRLKGIIHGVKDQTFNDLTGRMPRHTAVAFGHATCTKEDEAWALDHMSDLTFTPNVKQWATAPL